MICGGILTIFPLYHMKRNHFKVAVSATSLSLTYTEFCLLKLMIIYANDAIHQSVC
jgi:hypothetical protein